MTSPRAGWYGKLPCRGDFVGGGARGALIERWRDWAVACLPAVRAGGDAARDAFLIAPIWRFAARAGLFGPASGYGVIGPGADSGGRLFPVIAAVEAPVGDMEATLAAAKGWLDRADAALRAALDPAAAPDAFLPALDAPPSPPVGGGRLSATGLFEAEGRTRALADGPASPALFARLFGEPAPETVA